MIIEVEERFAKAAQRFLGVLKTIDEAAGRDAPVHEVEQSAWQGMLETTREEIAAYIAMQDTEEGACRHLVKDRMEQTGMRWEVEGAQAVLSLRAIYINEDWDSFHTTRIEQEQQARYPYRDQLANLLNTAA